MLTQRPPRLTFQVKLPGRQARLKEAVLYVAQECASAEYFGLVKLNKILWRADFQAFANRGTPVTGRQYQRLPLGPAPVEIVPVLNDLQASGFLTIERKPVYKFDELRPVPNATPNLRFFSQDDLDYVDESIRYYWSWTAGITSEDSHGIAWSTHFHGDPLPYESAYLSDEPVNPDQAKRLLAIAEQEGWNSR